MPSSSSLSLQSSSLPPPAPKPEEEFIGTVLASVVEMQLFNNVVSLNESVKLHLLPMNGVCAVRVDSLADDSIGFLDEKSARAVSYLMQQRLASTKVHITSMDDAQQHAGARVQLWGLPAARAHVEHAIRSFQARYVSTAKFQSYYDAPANAHAGLPTINTKEDEVYTGLDAISLADVENDVDKLFSGQVDFDTLSPREPHSSVIANLYPFQKQALAWMFAREEYKEESALESLNSTGEPFEAHRGGILADDMGLGKTIQLISLIASTSRQAGFPESDEYSASTLIICPLSVITNWECQIRKHVKMGKLCFATYHGSDRRHLDDDLDSYDVVITTYNIVATEFKDKKDAALFRTKWRRVVLDEAHVIRDKRTLQCKAVCALTAERRWCASGTPIQNKIDDFFALLLFLRVQPFTSFELWVRLVMKPLRNRDPKGLERLQTVLGGVCLRRKKTDKIEGKPILPSLPPKTVNIIELPFEDEERVIYEKLLETGKNRLTQNRSSMQNNNTLFLEMLLRMRQSCDHALLVPPKYLQGAQGLDEEKRMRTLLAEGSEECSRCDRKDNDAKAISRCCRQFFCEKCIDGVELCPGCQAPWNDRTFITAGKDDADVTDVKNRCFRMSGKLKFLVDTLKGYHAVDPTYKAIVFSQWTSFLDLIHRTLSGEASDCRGFKLKCVRLDGTMSHKSRQKSIQSFQENPDIKIFLISLNAGGVGLNLTAANKVILMDPWWNPATEDQAIDRVHRLGQKRQVAISRLVMKDSLEMKIMELQKKKRDMCTAALGGQFRKGKSKQEIKEQRMAELLELFS